VIEVDLGRRQRSFRGLDFGLGLKQVRLGRFEFDLRGARADQALVAVEIALGARDARFCLGDSGSGLGDRGAV
jgi:hypothetical protein